MKTDMFVGREGRSSSKEDNLSFGVGEWKGVAGEV